jgi:hypothetical protein
LALLALGKAGREKDIRLLYDLMNESQPPNYLMITAARAAVDHLISLRPGGRRSILSN